MHKLKTHESLAIAGLEGQLFLVLGEFSGKSLPTLGFNSFLWYKLALAFSHTWKEGKCDCNQERAQEHPFSERRHSNIMINIAVYAAS